MKSKVIVWRNFDCSAAGVVRVYIDNTGQAEKDLKMLQDHGDQDKKFEIQDVEVHGKGY